MKLTIESLRGVWRCQIDSRTEISETLEELLTRLAPDAPPEYVWKAAEVLGSVLGAEVVNVEQDYSDLFAALFPDTVYDEQWNPTPAQQAYFNPEVEGDGA